MQQEFTMPDCCLLEQAMRGHMTLGSHKMKAPTAHFEHNLMLFATVSVCGASRSICFSTHGWGRDGTTTPPHSTTAARYQNSWTTLGHNSRFNLFGVGGRRVGPLCVCMGRAGGWGRGRGGVAAEGGGYGGRERAEGADRLN